MNNNILRLIHTLLLLAISFIGLTGLQGGWKWNQIHLGEVLQIMISKRNRLGDEECRGMAMMSSYLLGSVFLGTAGSFLLTLGFTVAAIAGATGQNGSRLGKFDMRYNHHVLDIVSLMIALAAVFHILWGIIVVVHSNCKDKHPVHLCSTAVIMLLDMCLFNSYCLCTRYKDSAKVNANV